MEMKRLFVPLLVAAACSSGPQSKPVNEPATGAAAAILFDSSQANRVEKMAPFEIPVT